jgi:carboxylesterase type B
MSALAMSPRPFTPADHQIADKMSTYWANFIATGDPNGKDAAAWAAAGEKPGLTMEVGDRYAGIPIAGSEAKRSVLEKFFAHQ